MGVTSVNTDNLTPVFLVEQYEQMLQLIKKDAREVAVTAMTSKTDTSLISKTSTPVKEDWVIDSGATSHMTSGIRNLDIIKPYVGPKKIIRIPNGQKVDVTHVGALRINKLINLENVLYAPELCFNLISVAKLIREHNCVVCFYPEFCAVQDLTIGKLMGIGRLQNGLYVFEQCGKLGRIELTRDSAHVMHNVQDPVDWHVRLGHPSDIVLKHSNVNGVFDHKDNKCEICFQSK